MTDTKNADHLATASKIGGYIIESVLHQSAHSITYKCKDESATTFVIKELFPKHHVRRDTSGSIVALDAKSDESFTSLKQHYNQVTIALCAIQHRNLVQSIETISSNNTCYIVMQYEEGFTLQEIFKQTQMLDYADIKQIIFPLLDVLKLLHEQEILHLGINPNSILIRKDGTPVFLGIQSLYRQKDNSASAFVPKQDNYSAIENFSTDKNLVSSCSDIYSLAAVLYQCIYGHPPTSATDRYKSVMETGEDNFIGINQKTRAGFSSSMLKAVAVALSLEANKRPQQVAEWSQMFLELTEQGDMTMIRNSDPEKKAPAQISHQRPDYAEHSYNQEDKYKLFRSLVSGKKQPYYMKVLINQNDWGLIPRIYWNTGAFVFGLLWFFYRKMYLFGIIIIPAIISGIFILSFWLIQDYSNINKYWLISPTIDQSIIATIILTALFCGIFGNYFYYLHNLIKLSRAKKKYPDIKSQRNWLSTIGGISNASAIIMLAILIAAGFLSYQPLMMRDTQARKQMDEAILALKLTAKKVAAFRRQNGSWPKPTDDVLDKADIYGYNYINSIVTMEQLIVVTFKRENVVADYADRSIALFGKETDGKISWSCGSINLPLEFVPNQCKRKFK